MTGTENQSIAERPIKILLIEDDAADADYIREILVKGNRHAFELEWVDRFEQGLKRLRQASFDVILLDLSLPDSHGLGALTRLQTEGPGVPTVVLTGLVDDAVAVEAVRMGAQDYLVKGQVDRNELVRTLRYAVERHRLLVELEQRIEELKASEASVHNALSANADGVVILDRQGAIRFVNPAAEVLFGKTSEELLGETFGFPLVDGEATELDVVGKRGKTTVVEMRVVETVWQKDPAFLALLRDITERRQAEMALQQYADELKRSNQELEQFAYIASHDLQEPLRKIQAFGDRIASRYKDALDERGQDYLRRMQEAASRMQSLITDLLMLSRVTSKAQPFVEVDLDQVVHEVLSDLEVRIERIGGQVEVRDLPTVKADPMQMRQLLQNLISNALKFHREDRPPSVKVYGRALPGSAARGVKSPAYQIHVEDNGIGFDVKYLDRIFKPFQRLHGRNTYEGSGIGLAICNKIAERHGGAITATSTPGQGATFTITLDKNPDGGGAL